MISAAPALKIYMQIISKLKSNEFSFSETNHLMSKDGFAVGLLEDVVYFLSSAVVALLLSPSNRRPFAYAVSISVTKAVLARRSSKEISRFNLMSDQSHSHLGNFKSKILPI